MITVFKKIWNFSSQEQENIRNSILVGFIGALFNALQMGAVYYALVQIFQETFSMIDIVIVVGILLLSLLGSIVTQNISQLKQTHSGYFMASDKRIRIGEKLKRVPMGVFGDFNLGKLTNLSTTTLTQIETQVPMLLVIVLGGVLNTSVFVLFLFFLNTSIAALALIGMLAFFVVTYAMQKKSQGNKGIVEEVQTRLTKQVLATVQGMQVIKSYNMGGTRNKDLECAFDSHCDVVLGLEKQFTPFIAIQRMVIGVTIASMVFASLFLHISGDMKLADTIMVMIASFMLFDGLKGAGSSLAILRLAENSIDSLHCFDDMPEINDGGDVEPLANHTIIFDAVSFNYADKQALNEVSCTIPEKSITALVGPSGSGKSTFCNLIARFWDSNAGTVTIGGKDIKEYSLPFLMSNISMVFQQVYLFEDTIANNIAFGVPDASREEIIAVAQKALCHEFIEDLPQGYDTIIGEAGSNLSGGQKQRISIARAMLKNAPIVILDEATANVDPENEDKLRMAFEALTKDKTIIMIAHQLSTIKNADQILVLDQGELKQQGTHEELIHVGGLYKKLIEKKNNATKWKIGS